MKKDDTNYIDKNIEEIKEDEKIIRIKFKNQEKDKIELYENEFELCEFNNICMQNGTM